MKPANVHFWHKVDISRVSFQSQRSQNISLSMSQGDRHVEVACFPSMRAD